MNDERKKRWKDIIDQVAGWLFLVLILAGVGRCTYRSYTKDKMLKIEEQRREDSLKVAEQHYKDSVKAHDDSLHIAWRREQDSLDVVMNSKEYKDSVRMAQVALDKSTLVMVHGGDKFYHYMTQCLNASDARGITLMSRYEAERKGLMEHLPFKNEDIKVDGELGHKKTVLLGRKALLYWLPVEIKSGDVFVPFVIYGFVITKQKSIINIYTAFPKSLIDSLGIAVTAGYILDQVSYIDISQESLEKDPWNN